MIRIVPDSIFNATEECIVHQVNCVGLMGRGVAEQISRKFPQHRLDYAKLTFSYPEEERLSEENNPLLGRCIISKTNKKYDIAGVYGQINVGRNKVRTIKSALRQGLTELATKYKSLAIPYVIGCGLAGGNKTEIIAMLDEIKKETGCEIVLYRIREDVYTINMT